MGFWSPSLARLFRMREVFVWIVPYNSASSCCDTINILVSFMNICVNEYRFDDWNIFFCWCLFALDWRAKGYVFGQIKCVVDDRICIQVRWTQLHKIRIYFEENIAEPKIVIKCKWCTNGKSVSRRLGARGGVSNIMNQMDTQHRPSTRLSYNKLDERSKSMNNINNFLQWKIAGIAKQRIHLNIDEEIWENRLKQQQQHQQQKIRVNVWTIYSEWVAYPSIWWV